MSLTIGQRRSIKMGILAAIILFLFHSRTLVFQRVMNQGNECNPSKVPTPLNPAGQVWGKWQYLERRFRRYRPIRELEHKDFQGGQLAKPTIAILSSFLNIQPQEAKIMRGMHSDFIKEIPTYPELGYRGRGIVLVAGGRYAEYASTTLGMLRLMGSQLPIEVWLKDHAEEEDGWCDELAQEGIGCRYMDDYIQDQSAFTRPYQYKVAAIFFSSFEEVLFLDSDSIPVKNPDPIFDSLAYQDTGMVLWPDYWKSTESPWLSYITSQAKFQSTETPNTTTVDSGQMLWDKKRHWKTLCLSAYYNYHGPSYFYTLITQGGPGWGDKDTFPTALRALSLPFTQIPHRLQTQFLNIGNDQATGSGIAMLQADPQNLEIFQPLFLHSNLIKLSARRLMCAICKEFQSALTSQQRRGGNDVHFEGQAQMRGHSSWNSLNNSKRIFAIKSGNSLNYLGVLDTERDIWRVLERQACVGVWSEDQLCQRITEFLKTTFGVREKWRGQQGVCGNKRSR